MVEASKVATAISAAILCIAIGTAIGGAANVHWDGAAKINSVDFVTIILSALSVMLAILTIFLAVFGFIGWTSINDRLREHSANYFTNELQQGKPAYDLLRSVVRNVVYEGIEPVDEDADYEGDPPEGETADP